MRFPEFEGEWESLLFGDIATIKGGFAFDAKTLSSERRKYQIVKMGNLYQNQLNLDRTPSFIDIIDNRQCSFLLKKNDIAITLTGTNNKRDYGYSYLFKSEDNLLLNQRCALIRAKYDSHFLSYLIKTSCFLEQFFQSSAGGTGNQANVSTKDIESFIISVPKIKEQDKIGKFLSLIDERIETQSKIIDRLESLINGIIQTLMGNSKVKPGWKKLFLRDILTESKELNQDYHPVFSVSVSKGVINQIDYLGRSFAAQNTSNYNVVHFGDIVYTKSPTGKFPYGIVKQSRINEGVAVSPLYGVYKPKSSEIGNIVHHYFNNPINTNNYLHSLIQKGAKNTINITNQNFLNKEVSLPIDENEIKIISDLLESLSSKINLESNLYDKLKEQKQYLLKQMFI